MAISVFVQGLRIVDITSVRIKRGELAVGLIVIAGAKVVLLERRIELLTAVEKRGGLPLLCA